MALTGLAPGVVQAQAGPLSGRVVALDGTPVSGAEVIVMPAGPRSAADAAGRFHVDMLTPGRHELVVRRPGFRPDTLFVSVPTPQPTITIILDRLPAYLPTVHASALAADLPRVADREKSGISVVITGDSLRREFPGFSVDAVLHDDSDLWHTLLGWGFCKDYVFVDGKPMPPSPWHDRSAPQPDFDIRDRVHMRDIAAVEVTRFPEKVHEPWIDGTIVQYVKARYCVRVVLIWTKGFKQKPYNGPP